MDLANNCESLEIARETILDPILNLLKLKEGLQMGEEYHVDDTYYGSV
jgi:hypothetical protein